MKKKKNIRTSDPDRISNLPTNVRNTILACLPLREAVRTSILSKKWRYSWTSLSQLVFDATMFKQLLGDKLLVRYKLMSAIHQVLLLHQGTILKFSLSHPLLESCSEIDHLIVFLSKSGVEEFNLHIGKGNLYKLPSSFFSCQELTHLDLQYCEFSPPPAALGGFGRLISLKFVKVTFATCLFESFISSCTQLENLIISESSRINFQEISAPNLKYLRFEGTCKSLRLKNMPLLLSASFALDHRGENLNVGDVEICRLDEFFGCLPALEKLHANFQLFEFLAADGAPKKLPNLVNLKILTLSGISFIEPADVACLCSLISSSPMMRRIEIEMCTEGTDIAPVLEFLNTLDYPDLVLDELREVKLTDFSAVEPELAFIKLLLAKSPKLETMLIKPWIKCDYFLRDKSQTKLIRFRRASPMAEVLYEYDYTAEVCSSVNMKT